VTTDPNTRADMIAFYAAVEAIAEGKIAEVEIENRTSTSRDGVEVEEILTIQARREVKMFTPPPAPDQ
jgi:hypothetical protein